MTVKEWERKMLKFVFQLHNIALLQYALPNWLFINTRQRSPLLVSLKQMNKVQGQLLWLCCQRTACLIVNIATVLSICLVWSSVAEGFISGLDAFQRNSFPWNVAYVNILTLFNPCITPLMISKKKSVLRDEII